MWMAPLTELGGRDIFCLKRRSGNEPLERYEGCAVRCLLRTFPASCVFRALRRGHDVAGPPRSPPAAANSFFGCRSGRRRSQVFAASRRSPAGADRNSILRVGMVALAMVGIGNRSYSLKTFVAAAFGPTFSIATVASTSYHILESAFRTASTCCTADLLPVPDRGPGLSDH
jgi:hypothetical protein